MPFFGSLRFEASRLPAVVALASALSFFGCGRGMVPGTQAASVNPAVKEATNPPIYRQIRATGTVEAIHSYTVQTPQIAGQGGNLTLTDLAANGASVKVGDILAEFDHTAQVDAAIQAKTKYEDLAHQVEQRVAQNQSDAEKRSAALQKAEGDQAKAELELRKGPLLSEIDRLKNEAKAEDARAHVASLEKSGKFHDVSDAAGLRILELQRDRQKVALERAEHNSEQLSVRAPIAGMVALQNVWRNGSMGHAQEGDQLFGGQPLLRIFDPNEMEVRTQVGEPDGAVLVPGARAMVSLDAYPELVFPAHFLSASPVAASALGSPIKNFTATFRLEKPDPHFLPDLSVAVIILPPGVGQPGVAEPEVGKPGKQ
jgi:HlyD family secretion protein